MSTSTTNEQPKATFCNQCGTSADDCERARVSRGMPCCEECSRYSSHNASEFCNAPPVPAAPKVERSSVPPGYTALQERCCARWPHDLAPYGVECVPPVASATDACTWPGCNDPALCRSGNFGDQLVCSLHFQITNGPANSPATPASDGEGLKGEPCCEHGSARITAMRKWLHLFVPSDDGRGCAALIGAGKARCGYPDTEPCHFRSEDVEALA